MGFRLSIGDRSSICFSLHLSQRRSQETLSAFSSSGLCAGEFDRICQRFAEVRYNSGESQPRISDVIPSSGTLALFSISVDHEIIVSRGSQI